MGAGAGLRGSVMAWMGEGRHRLLVGKGLGDNGAELEKGGSSLELSRSCALRAEWLALPTAGVL